MCYVLNIKNQTFVPLGLNNLRANNGQSLNGKVKRVNYLDTEGVGNKRYQ